jgi:hypothetical protein
MQIINVGVMKESWQILYLCDITMTSYIYMWNFDFANSYPLICGVGKFTIGEQVDWVVDTSDMQ